MAQLSFITAPQFAALTLLQKAMTKYFHTVAKKPAWICSCSYQASNSAYVYVYMCYNFKKSINQ